MAIVSHPVDPVRFVDDRSLGRFQILIMSVCFLVSLFDGLDSQILSVVVPSVRRDLHLEISQLGSLLSASQLGALLGAFAFGLVADKWGRRPAVIASTLLFSVGTFATASSTSFASLAFLRVLTGVGIGGAIPSYVALAAEYAPIRFRAVVTAVVVSGVPAGGVLTGLLGSGSITMPGGGMPDWRQIFMFCGGVSGAVWVLSLLILPESLGFLAVHRKNKKAIERILRRLAPGNSFTSEQQIALSSERPNRASLISLFAPELRVFTLIYGLMFMLTYGALIGQLVWTPTLLEHSGMPRSQASLALSYHNFGAIVGNILAGIFIDRFRSASLSVVACFFASAAVAIALVGISIPDISSVSAASTASGVLIAACSTSLYAMAVLRYPVASRSTGIGWGSALSRIGAVVGPLSVGSLASAQLSATFIFVCLGSAVFINAVLVLVLGTRNRQADTSKIVQ